jgi:hypothetical protein
MRHPGTAVELDASKKFDRVPHICCLPEGLSSPLSLLWFAQQPSVPHMLEYFSVYIIIIIIIDNIFSNQYSLNNYFFIMFCWIDAASIWRFFSLMLSLSLIP